MSSVMRPSDVKSFLKVAIKKGWPILLKSAPGCAKTSLVTQACEEENVELIVSHPVVNESIDTRSLPGVSREEKTGKPYAVFIPFNQLEILVNAKKPTVFFFDDLGQAPATVQAACMQLLLARTLNEYVISDKVTFMAATNRRQDRAGVQGILEPVKSRFYSIIEVAVNLDDWIQFAYENKLPAGLIAYVRWRGVPALFKFEPTTDIQNSPCPRTVTRAGEMLRDGFPDHMRMTVFEGSCGEVWAREFTSFLKIMENLPSIDEIIANPTKAPVPAKDKADVIYATCGALIERVNKETFKNIVTYSERLSAEYSTMIVRDCIMKNPD